MNDVYSRIETGNAVPANLPLLLDVVRGKVRALHYSRRTEEAYVHWIEVNTLLAHMEGTPLLMARLLYGTGMRLMECVRLRVKDVEFSHHEIVMRDGKGGKDRMTMLPESLVPDLDAQLRHAEFS